MVKCFLTKGSQLIIMHYESVVHALDLSAGGWFQSQGVMELRPRCRGASAGSAWSEHQTIQILSNILFKSDIIVMLMGRMDASFYTENKNALEKKKMLICFASHEIAVRHLGMVIVTYALRSPESDI